MRLQKKVRYYWKLVQLTAFTSLLGIGAFAAGTAVFIARNDCTTGECTQSLAHAPMPVDRRPARLIYLQSTRSLSSIKKAR